jgi:hypothetical protein
MAENYLTDPNKKANSKYSRLLEACRKLDEFDVSSVSVLEQALKRLKAGETLDARQSFDMLFKFNMILPLTISQCKKSQ